MQFVNSDSVIKAATAAGIVQQDNRAEVQSYLDAYDVALDGRLDRGFYSSQVQPDMYLTVNHELSRDGAMTLRLNRLMQSMAQTDQESAIETARVPAAADDAFNSPLGIVAAVLLSPLLIFGLISGCGPASQLPPDSGNNHTHWTDGHRSGPFRDDPMGGRRGGCDPRQRRNEEIGRRE
ncbi:MAG: hypothetical protein WC956_08250 [bacterium]